MWFDKGITQKQDFMIVVCDTYDWTDYPVFCTTEEFDEKHAEFDGKNMQKIMEVYDLSVDKESQINEFRAFHYPIGFRKGN